MSAAAHIDRGWTKAPATHRKDRGARGDEEPAEKRQEAHEKHQKNTHISYTMSSSTRCLFVFFSKKNVLP